MYHSIKNVLISKPYLYKHAPLARDAPITTLSILEFS